MDKQTLHIYGDESGQVGGRHFLIGLLFVPSGRRTEYERQLQHLKLEHKFTYTELHYSELTRDDKAKLAMAAVDWYFSSEAVFKCTVVPGGIFDHTRFRDNIKFISAEELSYNVIYKSAINYHTTVEDRADGKERNAFTNEKFRVAFWNGKPGKSAAQRQSSNPI